MENFIKVYDDVLDPQICKEIIQKFEVNTDQQEDTILKGHRSFKEIQLNKHKDWKPIVFRHPGRAAPGETAGPSNSTPKNLENGCLKK